MRCAARVEIVEHAIDECGLLREARAHHHDRCVGNLAHLVQQIVENSVPRIFSTRSLSSRPPSQISLLFGRVRNHSL